ncbi:DNA N6-methyl adenine demethylase-like, partial [Teleopsis dalmanni]|uniref:DNA N6-methyl adenine demethylase-like n=1 Tax=Teleopsis dalmanni TaxID=139649 RepID=UPI0018CE195D
MPYYSFNRLTAVESIKIVKTDYNSINLPRPRHDCNVRPTAPMAFYPTWQTDPSQGWQNQFIQQIPQNTPAITSLNSLDFQTQSYAYPSNGYVQTGLGFDPNYGRSPYGAPVQRYDFQSQQLSSAPINQVGLQGVGFAPAAVTYAGQVSTAPAPPSVGLQQQQHLGVGSDLNKTMSGNDTPGYPRVSSVPPRSLNCNGYSGDYSGTQQQQQHQTSNHNSTASTAVTPNAVANSLATVNGGQSAANANNNSVALPQASPMQPPNAQSVPQSPTRNLMQQHQQQQQQQQARHVSQSPNHIPQSPNGNLQAQQQQQQTQYNSNIPQSPHHNPLQQQQTQNHIASPPQQQQQQMQQDWNWNTQQQQQQQQQTPGADYQQGERVNLNTRIKSMILRKNDPKDSLSGAAPPDILMQVPPPPLSANGNGAQQQQQQQTGHFLSYSHHLRNDSVMNSNGSNGTSVAQQTRAPTHPHQQNQQQQHQQIQNMQASNTVGMAPTATLAPEPIGGGGDQIWKPHHVNSFKKPVATGFQNSDQHHQQTLQSQQHTATNNSNNNTHTETPTKKPSRRSKSSRNTNTEQTDIEKNSNDPGGGLHSAHVANTKNMDKMNYPSSQYPPHPDYQAQYIKTEPGLVPPQPNKMEGYERNYQNFIQYADFCQNEVQGQSGGPTQHIQQQHQNQSEYAGYHHNAAYYSGSTSFQQNYQQNFVPGYQHSNSAGAYSTPNIQSQHSSTLTKSTNGGHPKSPSATGLSQLNNHMMDIDRKPDTNSIIPLPTNYEKDIPAHAYPIPPHRYPLGHMPSHLASGLIEPKIEDMGMLNQSGTYPFLGEGGPAAIKDSSGFSCCRQGGTLAPTTEHLKDGSCTGIQTKDEIIDEEDEQNANANGAKPKKKGVKQEENNEIVVKHEKINPIFDTTDRLEKGNKTEIPECDCFQSDKNPPEPGTYYTHLGTASTLAELRKELEDRCQISGRQLRIEKIVYTGKEGKTNQGCPVAKWVIRRADPEEKILVVVKKRPGHRCLAAFIVVCMVAWDGMPRMEADNAYKNLIPKLNKFGLPTTRRCATNENRTCACQGLDPETSGASYSFGCSWSMYYNGCKYARSKTVRKFRLSVKSEESAIEDHMNLLATVLAPLFKQVCPRSYDNQTKYEKEAPDCRLGLEPGRPFSGVTACLDFCAHAHRDLHNMQDGCTVHVALLKPCNRDSRPPDDEQFHVLPLYTIDSTDEFESVEGQREKHRIGAVQVLEKYPCEVRVRSTPLIPCRRHGKKRKEDEPATTENDTGAATTPVSTPQATAVSNTPPAVVKKESGSSKSKSKSKSNATTPTGATTPSSAVPPTTPSPRCQTPVTNNPSPAGSAFTTPPVNNNHSNSSAGSAQGGNPNQLMSSNSSLMNMATMIDTFTDAQLQSNQISSTVLDSPYSYDYQTGSYIDSRNYYGNWPPPHTPHVVGMTPTGVPNAAPAAPMTPTTPTGHHTHHTPAPLTPHHDANGGYGTPYNNLPTAGSQQLTQVHDVRGEVKSRGSEENPDSTTLVNNNLAESKLTTLTPLTPMSNLTQHHHHPHHANPLEEGFVKPKPPT